VRFGDPVGPFSRRRDLDVTDEARVVVVKVFRRTHGIGELGSVNLAAIVANVVVIVTDRFNRRNFEFLDIFVFDNAFRLGYYVRLPPLSRFLSAPFRPRLTLGLCPSQWYGRSTP
jgi:hypothetical protein